jgi:prepilin-type processing-associated H-X9-DG protein
MRHKGFTWVEALVVIFIVLVLAAILFPVFQRTGHKPPHRAICQSNLKQIGLAFAQYIQDNNEFVPRVAHFAVPDPQKEKPYGWADALQPYLKSAELYQCRSEEKTDSSGDPTQSGYIDYWMNSRLSDLSLAVLQSPAETILSGDGNDGNDLTNARYNINALPQRWIKDKTSPAYRHLEGANYMFADGHVEWHTPDKIKTTPISKGGPTFAWR